MEKKVVQCGNKGMLRDISISKSNNEFAYHNQNIRITARDSETLLSITNEKGNKPIKLVTKKVLKPCMIYVSGNTIKTQYMLESSVTIWVSCLVGDSISSAKIVLPKGTSTYELDSGITYWLNIQNQQADDHYIYYCKGESIPSGEISVDFSLEGTCLGHAILNDYLVLFLKTDYYDYIYRLEFNEDDNLNVIELYKGNLNFKYDAPIEALSNYESSTLQKVYWVDGINQPRVINIVDFKEYNDTSFDFLLPVENDLYYEVTKQYEGTGYYTAGTIQYFFTYQNKHGQESNIVNMTPLYYVSDKNKGVSPNEVCNCQFNIKLTGYNKDFDYINIYVIHRGSLNNVSAYKVTTLQNEQNGITISYIDNGNNLTYIDPTDLLYKESNKIIASTITAKDNTLFLGNLKTSDIKLDKEVTDLFKSYIGEDGISSLISFEYGYKYKNEIDSDLYPYETQLDYPSNFIKSFKGGEKYRFGIRFKDNLGQESSTYWIGDAINNLYPAITNGYIKRAEAKITLNDNIKNLLISKGYVNAQLLIANPSESDRTVKAQGFICPTMFNFKQRVEDAPFAISSWFTRIKNSSLDCGHYKSPFGNNSSKGEIQGNSESGLSAGYIKGTNVVTYRSWSLEYWKEAAGRDIRIKIWSIKDGEYTLINTKKTGWSASETKAANKTVNILEEYGITNHGINTDTLADLLKDCDVKKQWTIIPGYSREEHQSNNIPTNATDSEVYAYENSSYYAQDNSIVTFHSPEIELTTNNFDNVEYSLRIVGIAPITSVTTDYTIKYENGYFTGDRTLDFNFNAPNTSDNIEGLISYPLYLDLNESYDSDPGGKETYFALYPWHKEGSISKLSEDKAILKSKTIGNLRYSNKTIYCGLNNAKVNDIYPLRIYDYVDSQLISVETQWGNKTYQGNYDYMLTYPSSKGYSILGVQNDQFRNNESIDYEDVKNKINDIAYLCYDPIRIKYKSSKHGVFAFKPVTSNAVNVLPYGDAELLNILPWTKEETSYLGYNINVPSFTDENNLKYVYIAELYVEDNSNAYGGITESALKNNVFIPINDYKDIQNTDYLFGKEGDTYYQRYDTFKTYSEDDNTNNITEIVSVMLETHLNLDGNTSNKRKNTNLVSSKPQDNVYNTAYNQDNNYKASFILDSKYAINTYPQQIVWTKSKNNLEDNDSWTHINTVSALNLDGDKGELRALKRFNNHLIAFQDKAISEILFNSRTQIATTEGLPIEVANSGKVEGKNYITTNYGCLNKWSIVEGSAGLYFVDDLTHNICVLNNGITPLSSTKGFSVWAKENTTNTPWEPLIYNGIRSYYDKTNNDVYFTTKDTSLCYSETLQEFVSFYDYKNVPLMVNLNGKFISYYNNGLWEQNAGEYNSFFGTKYPYYVEYKVCPNAFTDKIYSNVEYRADMWKENSLTDDTFDTLSVHTEYQSGTTSLKDKHKYPNFEKKFRIWRIDIPRDSKNKLNRIRNPWINIKLSKDEPDTEKTILHDVLLYYYE